MFGFLTAFNDIGATVWHCPRGIFVSLEFWNLEGIDNSLGTKTSISAWNNGLINGQLRPQHTRIVTNIVVEKLLLQKNVDIFKFVVFRNIIRKILSKLVSF